MRYLIIFSVTSFGILLSACSLLPQTTYTTPSSSEAQISNSAALYTPRPTPYLVSGNLFTLLGTGSKKCTWIGNFQERPYTGTAYVHETKIRAELITKISLLPVSATLIGDGTKISAWADALPGKKIELPYSDVLQILKEASSSAQGIVSQNTELAQFLQPTTFTCEQWSADPDKFVIK